MKITRSVLHRLPKAELHCHLDGSLRISTILDLAKIQKINLPTSNLKDLTKFLVITDRVNNLEEYLERFSITLSVLQTPESLTRTAYELAEDCWNDGVRYLELRYSPILHTEKGMTPPESIDAVKKGLEHAEEDFGIQTGIIICGIRNISPDISIALAELAVEYKNRGVVGFDLAGEEENFPAKEHRKAFYLIQNNNINSTIHAGEAYGPASIHQSIHYCSANRIGHGTKLHEDKDLMHYVKDHRIALEICLTSNIQVQSVDSFKSHPFKLYLDEDIRVTLNTDNRLISNTTLTDEYKLAIDTFNLNTHNLRRIIINGFKSAFLPHKQRRELIRTVIDELESEFGFDDPSII
jgi:adenosine deaminase